VYLFFFSLLFCSLSQTVARFSSLFQFAVGSATQRSQHRRRPYRLLPAACPTILHQAVTQRRCHLLTTQPSGVQPHLAFHECFPAIFHGCFQVLHCRSTPTYTGSGLLLTVTIQTVLISTRFHLTTANTMLSLWFIEKMYVW
jgi:hypothetical protein